MRIPVPYIVPVAILLLSSCRTTTGGLQFRPVSGPETFPEYAIVYFYRPYREFNWGGYPYIFVNGMKKFPLKNETYNVLLLPPGEYEIKAEGSTWGTNWYPGPVTGVFAVEAGLEYYLRVIPTTQGSWNVDYLGSIADEVFNVGNLQIPPWPISGVDMRMIPKDRALYELTGKNDDNAGSKSTANLSQQTASGSLVTGNGVSGTYRSKITGSHREESEFEITLNGNKFYGVSADKEWEIEGALEGDTIKFAWYGPGNSGKGKFKIDSRGNLAGKYTGSWGSGEWTLTKSQ